MAEIFRSIIVRMPNWLGDAVMATPILEDLKEHWPEASITAMCQGGVGQLLHGNPFVDEIFSFQKPKGFLDIQEKKQILKKLQSESFDLGILLPNSFSSAWKFLRGKVKRRLGYSSDIRRFLLTDPISIPKERNQEHLVITYKRLLCSLGITLTSSHPKLFISPSEKIHCKSLLRNHSIAEAKKMIGINPGAAFGTAKCWLPERFRAVSKRLLEDPNLALIFFGDSSSIPLITQICEGLPRTVNLAGKTSLRELIALIASCHAFLTNDSGPMHIAAALNTPLVALFGSTNEVATGPYQHGTVIHKHVDCSPCYRRTCPIDFRCMTRIHVDEVYEALIALLP